MTVETVISDLVGIDMVYMLSIFIQRRRKGRLDFVLFCCTKRIENVSKLERNCV
jgi:hypothetical protein